VQSRDRYLPACRCFSAQRAVGHDEPVRPIWLCALVVCAVAAAAEERQFDSLGLDFYPMAPVTCGEAAQRLLIEMRDGAVNVRASHDAGGAIAVRESAEDLAFMLGSEGCRVGVVLGAGDDANVPSGSRSAWARVSPHPGGRTFAKPLHAASPACEAVQVQRGSVLLGILSQPKAGPASSPSEEAALSPDRLRFSVGQGGCAIRFLTFKAD
jgi:hypothetical protein